MLNNSFRVARQGLEIPLRAVKEMVDNELKEVDITVSIPTIYRFETGLRANRSDVIHMVLFRCYNKILTNYERQLKVEEIDRMGVVDEHM